MFQLLSSVFFVSEATLEIVCWGLRCCERRQHSSGWVVVRESRRRGAIQASKALDSQIQSRRYGCEDLVAAVTAMPITCSSMCLEGWRRAGRSPGFRDNCRSRADDRRSRQQRRSSDDDDDQDDGPIYREKVRYKVGGCSVGELSKEAGVVWRVPSGNAFVQF